MKDPKPALTAEQLNALFYDFEDIQKRQRRIKQCNVVLVTVAVVGTGYYAHKYKTELSQLPIMTKFLK